MPSHEIYNQEDDKTFISYNENNDISRMSEAITERTGISYL